MNRIPAIDIINGTVVRLTKGDFDEQTSYGKGAVAIAQSYQEAGAERLHVIDLDAARGRPSNAALIKQIAAETDMQIQVGGGIRSTKAIEDYLTVGVWAVIIGSKAVSDKVEVLDWVSNYGKDRIIIGADVRNQNIATDGWYNTTDINIREFVAYYMDRGADQFLCTDISRDGTLTGPAEVLYSSLLSMFPKIRLTASGGVASIADITKLEALGLHAVVIGKALLEGKILTKELWPDA